MNTKSPTPTLDEAVAAAKLLPDDMQTAIASEILERADALVNSQITNEHRAIIKERMSKPRTYVPREQVTALMRKYNPSL